MTPTNKSTIWAAVALMLFALPAHSWTKRFNVPQLTANGYAARPQGVFAVGDDELLITVQFQDQFSRAYRIQPSTGASLGMFQFPAPYVHIAAIARRADGSMWFGDYATGALLEVDVPASFTSGTAVILEARTVMGPTLLSGVEWVTINGQEYLLLGEYRTTGAPQLVILSHESGWRLTMTQRLQGIVYRDGALYVSSNRLTGEGSGGVGRVQRIDLAAFIATGARSGIWTDYLLETTLAPSNYPEDLSFSPDGTLWTLTEGETSTGTAGWLAGWSR